MIRLVCRWLIGVALVILTFGPAANATPITYAESVSGDLQALCPCNVFAFDLGVNSVSGTSFQNTSLNISDFDSFAFFIPVGAQLTKVTYSFIATFSGGGTGGTAADRFVLDEGNAFPIAPFISDEIVNFMAASPVSLFSALPLDSGTYTLQNFEKIATLGLNTSVDYRWEFTVSTAVPEPETLRLLGLGLIGLFLSATQIRRKSIASAHQN